MLTAWVGYEYFRFKRFAAIAYRPTRIYEGTEEH
jgi:hypothetical protein